MPRLPAPDPPGQPLIHHHQSGDDLAAGPGEGGIYDLGRPGEPEAEPEPAVPTALDELAALWRSCAPDLTDEQVAVLAQYRDLLHERNQRVNLTAVRDYPGIERRLILESLRLLPALRRERRRAIACWISARAAGCRAWSWRSRGPIWASR